MILRASNDKKPELPSHRWACWSSDGGRSWTKPKPWTYPFVIGEVDLGTGLLVRKSVRVVDTLGAGEDPLLTLSNFYARQDRLTGEIALHMTRLFALPDGWKGDAFLYHIRLTPV